MTRLQQARYLALTDGYWRAYCDGLDDKHNVTDPQPPENPGASSCPKEHQ